jgi:hypothetical protein
LDILRREMGLARIHPEDVDIVYDSIGETGASRCGELRSDGINIYGLFKGNDATPIGISRVVKIEGYSGNDIKVGAIANDAEEGMASGPSVTVALNKYAWFKLRGAVEAAPVNICFNGCTIGETLASFDAGTIDPSGAGRKFAIALETVAGLATPAFMVVR